MAAVRAPPAGFAPKAGGNTLPRQGNTCRFNAGPRGPLLCAGVGSHKITYSSRAVPSRTPVLDGHGIAAEIAPPSSRLPRLPGDAVAGGYEGSSRDEQNPMNSRTAWA